jgi:hypothetical protein
LLLGVARYAELIRRGGAVLNLETEQANRHGIDIGRGGVWLNLSEDQYQKLRAK